MEKENKNEKQDNYCYAPCREEGCNGFLTIDFNPLNFSISAKCSENSNHLIEKIYYKTFERFYLKEKKDLKCLQCGIIPKDSKFYLCTNCEKFY